MGFCKGQCVWSSCAALGMADNAARGPGPGEQGLKALGVISVCLGGEDTSVHFTFRM